MLIVYQFPPGESQSGEGEVEGLRGSINGMKINSSGSSSGGSSNGSSAPRASVNPGGPGTGTGTGTGTGAGAGAGRGGGAGGGGGGEPGDDEEMGEAGGPGAGAATPTAATRQGQVGVETEGAPDVRSQAEQALSLCLRDDRYVRVPKDRKYYGTQLSANDILALSGPNWLTDDLIAFYFQYLKI